MPTEENPGFLSYRQGPPPPSVDHAHFKDTCRAILVVCVHNFFIAVKQFFPVFPALAASQDTTATFVISPLIDQQEYIPMYPCMYTPNPLPPERSCSGQGRMANFQKGVSHSTAVEKISASPDGQLATFARIFGPHAPDNTHNVFPFLFDGYPAPCALTCRLGQPEDIHGTVCSASALRFYPVFCNNWHAKPSDRAPARCLFQKCRRIRNVGTVSSFLQVLPLKTGTPVSKNTTRLTSAC